jgi:adenylyl- and sulfurtransferase ThiI
MTEVFNMNKEEIIKLAREVGLLPDNLHPAPQTHHMAQKQKNLERFAALVAAEKEKQIIDILRRLQERNDSHNYYAYAINVIKGEI